MKFTLIQILLAVAALCRSLWQALGALIFRGMVRNGFVICATSEELAAVASSPMLRDYAQGAAQDATKMLEVASFLAPNVPVGTGVGRYKKYDQKNRFRIPRTVRAFGGEATKIGFSASDALYQATPHALDFPIDNLLAVESEDLENIAKEAADMTAEVGALSWEKEVVDAALGALGAGTAAAWTDNVDPIKFLDEAILNVLKAAKSGSMMNIRILFGATAWLIFKNHPLVTKKFISNPKGGTNPQVSLDMASSLLLTEPECKTTYSVYDDAAEGLDEDINFVLDSNVIVFAGKPNPTRLDPSFMKTFAPRGRFMVPGSYPTTDQRGNVIKFDWYAVPEVTNSAAGKLYNVTDA